MRERLALRVHLEDLAAPVAVGPVDDDLPVEAARAQQRRIEDVGPVGRGDQDDVVLHLEAVHLDEQLVQRLLALVVAAAEAGAAMAADRVDLVHEDDAGVRLLGLLEQVADARGADADEHLDEVGARDREERHPGLAGDRAREQRLAGAGRPVQQHALRDPRAERLELLRVLEELLDLLQLLDRLVDAATSLKPIFGESGAIRFARDLPKLITLEPPPCIWFIRKIQKPISSRNGRNWTDQRPPSEKPPTPFESKLTLCFCSRSWNASADWSLG